MSKKKPSCPVCLHESHLFDVVDFNKSCEEQRGKFLPLSGKSVYYASCPNCLHCFCPEIINWSKDLFSELIYNSNYIDIDPDYIEKRPNTHSVILEKTFGTHKKTIRHLDYGGGNGSLSHILKKKEWNSSFYEPFSDSNYQLPSEKFNLITSFEVFEHVPDPHKLMHDLNQLTAEDGIIFFTTLLSDKNIITNNRLSWWYASPRNGHINLFSKKSLNQLANQYDYQLFSFSDGLHLMLKSVPAWAKHLFKN